MLELKNKIRKNINKSGFLHISIIIIGIIFILIPTFHTNLWFDESYSVAIANKNYSEIWTIGGNDVHPVLYYWILHTLKIIFGSKIIIYRLFSVLCTAMLGIIGYTHIRKEFGEKTGIMFSFFTFFLPVNVIYAGEIRMYSLAMLFVTLMSIYAYKICKNKEQKHIKNWILFAVFSLSSAYTHYYGLMAAGLENIIVFIFFILQAKKEKKFIYNLKIFIVSAVMQILLYLPWVISLLKQVSQVSSGFWIGIHFPGTLIELFTFPFTGNLEGSGYIQVPIAVIFATIIFAYTIYLINKNKHNKEINATKYAIRLWLTVLIAACIVSIIILRPIIYARYMLCVGGLFIFYISSLLAEKGNEKITLVICTISVVLSINTLCFLVQENYGKQNQEFQNYIKQNIKEGDIFICGNELSGFVVSSYFPENKLYFYDEDHWNVGPAYKAYGDTVYDLDFLTYYEGRVWAINTNHYKIYEKLKDRFRIELLDQRSFNVEYKKNPYTLTLIHKE